MLRAVAPTAASGVGSITSNGGTLTVTVNGSAVNLDIPSSYLASPPAIGGTAPAAGKFTTLGTTGLLTLNFTGQTSNTQFTGELIENTTPATLNNQQYSPSTSWAGQAWATTPAASQVVAYTAQTQTAQGGSAGGGSWVLSVSVNGSAPGVIFSVNGSGLITPVGGIDINTAGKGIAVKEGSNAKQGTSTLSGGTVVVSNSSVTANSRIFITAQSLGTVAVPSAYGVSARTPGTSFTILASAPTDTSVVAWEIFEPG